MMYKFAAMAALAVAAASSDRRGYGRTDRYAAHPNSSRNGSRAGASSYGNSRSGNFRSDNSSVSQSGQSRSGTQYGRPSQQTKQDLSQYKRKYGRTPQVSRQAAPVQKKSNYYGRNNSVRNPELKQRLNKNSYGRGRVSSQNRQYNRKPTSYGSDKRVKSAPYGADRRVAKDSYGRGSVSSNRRQPTSVGSDKRVQSSYFQSLKPRSTRLYSSYGRDPKRGRVARNLFASRSYGRINSSDKRPVASQGDSRSGSQVVCDAVPALPFDFDAEAYMGMWYSQQHSTGPAWSSDDNMCTTAEYKNLDMEAGTFDVYNSFVTSNQSSRKGMSAAGFIKDDGEDLPSGQYMVSFFGQDVPKPNYLIVDTDFDSYSIVYGCDGKHQNLWIMSREPIMESGLLANLNELAKERLPNYDWSVKRDDVQGGSICEGTYDDANL